MDTADHMTKKPIAVDAQTTTNGDKIPIDIHNITKLRDELLNDITPSYSRIQLFLEKSKSQKDKKKIVALQKILLKLEIEIKNININ